MELLKLNKGKFAKVDDADWEDVSRYKWLCHEAANGRFYAVRGSGKSGIKVSLHRHILGLTDPKTLCDHRDLDGLNNQRGNLRTCNKSQNATNRKVDKRSKTGFKGVTWHGQMNKWRAYIVLNYKQKHLGLFADPTEAAKAYDRAAIEMHGEFCRLNFPNE